MRIKEISKILPEVEQPGLSQLREAVANAARKRLPGRKTILQDAMAGLNSTLGSAPDGMANGILAGVNPVYGLYASMIGPFVGAIFTSTQLMIINATSAAALAANQSLIGLTGEQRDRSLFLMVVLIGVFQIVLGLMRAGQLTRFVSYSVMTGFLTGVAGLMVLSQFPTITGIEASGANKLSQAIDVIANIRQADPFTLGAGILALVLVIVLSRTPVGNFSSLVAIAIPSVLVGLLRWDSVETARNFGEIAPGFPAISWPSLNDLSPDVVVGALAVSLITIVQGAGVSQSVPNPDGAPRRTSRDILAQGAANLASGFFRGLPVGGSLSATSLSVLGGAGSRWSVILAGVWMAVLVLLVPSLIAYVAMPALGALLIITGIRTIKPQDWLQIWGTGWAPLLASIVTLITTLTLPIDAAVGIGVVLSALLYLLEASGDLSVVELVRHDDGTIEERKHPKRLKDNQITVLDIYGPLFYASVQTLGRVLPSPLGAKNPVVVLRLRGHTRVGATLIDVLTGYARKLKEGNGRLYLTGMSEVVYEQLERAGKLGQIDNVHTYSATSMRGQSTQAAVADAREWLVSQNEETAPDSRPSASAAQEDGE